ncbi:uncharacterized protein PV07_08957 [Cladophialophora immunda]|uniref:Carboxylesterase family protein n=1 Tax=Cladophialophora immunda TaxID=569365 RepID=A0A0D2CQD7_9EURO|nr:uncharacterized protein PV07_08957 [Cladophialophora immunda]KIW25814.1 hypothetical protein PV07_08957 [Cladophialophora immunda]
MRMTRAALRAQAQEEPQLIYEDSDANANNSLQDDCADANANQDLVRPPLKDITTEINPSTTEDPFADEEHEPMQKAKSRKGRKAKLDNVGEESSKGESDEPQEPQPEDASDSHQLESSEGRGSIQDTSSAVTIEKLALRDEVTAEAVDATLEEQGIAESTSTPQQSHTGPPKTPKFDPSVHRAMEEVTPSASNTVEDSFVEKITSRTPGRLQILLNESKSPDPFAEQMRSRTPRIEDSVEAIDALEDAIEKISETLPALDELKIESPVKMRKSPPARLNPRSTTAPIDPQKKLTGRQPAQPSRRPVQKPGTTSGSLERPKLSGARGSSTNPTAKATTAAKPAKRPIVDGHKTRESSGQGAAPPLSFSNSPVKNLPNTTKKQLPNGALSTSKPGFIPAKSTKSPTKPKFSLPGDAVAAKLKAQREERMKREEEAANEKKAFKARPVPAKISRPSVVPRENRASQARMSIYAIGGNKENVEPKPAAATQPKPRPTSLGPKSKTSETPNVKASVRRTTTSATPAKPRASIIQLATGQKSMVTKEDVVQQKAKGKEVFERSKAETERLEKERREKEEAARKARAEAAERGRQASREWAEKQKKKIAAKILAAKEKEKAGGSENGAGQEQTRAAVSAS